MADANKKDVAAFDKIQEAFKSLGFGDSKKIALEKLGLTDKSTQDEIKAAAEAFEKDPTHRPLFTGAKRIELEQFRQDELFKAAGAPEALNTAKGVIANKEIQLSKDGVLSTPAQVESYIKGLGGAQDSELLKGREKLEKQFAAMNKGQASLDLGNDFLKEATTLSAAGKTAAQLEPAFDPAIHIKGTKGFTESVTKQLEEAHQLHLDGLTDDAARKALTEKLGKLDTSLVTNHYGEIAKDLEVVYTTDEAKRVAEALHKAHLDGGLKTVHVNDEAVKTFKSGAGLFAKTEENAGKFFKNLGAASKSVLKEAGSVKAGMSNKMVAGIAIGGTVAGAALVGKMFGKETVLDEQGNPVTNEAGEEQKRTNGLKFVAGAAATVGAIFLADKYAFKGQGLKAAKEVVGPWTEKLFGSGASKGKGFGGMSV